MKSRAGYVSNSSSTSFISIIAKNKDKQLMGDLINDLNNIPNESPLTLIFYAKKEFLQKNVSEFNKIWFDEHDDEIDYKDDQKGIFELFRALFGPYFRGIEDNYEYETENFIVKCRTERDG